MIAAILTTETQRLFDQLNRRGHWQHDLVAGKNTHEILRAIEGSDQYNLILVDVDALSNVIDEAIDAIGRIRKTTTADIIVIAQGYEPDGSIVRDILSLGIDKDMVLCENDTLLKRDLLALLPAPSAAEPTEPPAPELRPDAPVTPPSQISKADAKQSIIHKPPIKQRRCMVIALAGAGSRIGTTTQAMQLLLYLRSHDRKAALVEMHGRDVLQQYVSLFSDKDVELISENHFRIRGCDIYNTSQSFLKIKNNYEYIILDYGRFADLNDQTAFLDKDVKIICCGVKPWESSLLDPVFSIDDGSIHYLFSFVPSTDIPEVRDLMADSAGMTHFAEYSPDLFRYCGNDDMYSGILQLRDEPKASGKPSLTDRVKGVFSKP